MKVLLTTLNAKWSQSALALRYIRESVKDLSIHLDMVEYTINAHWDDVLRQIHREKYDLVLFSVYIWNRNETVRIAKHLKKMRPELTIAFGGPEVSYQSSDVLEGYPWLDVILVGEGEVTARAYLEAMVKGQSPSAVSGLVYRQGQAVVATLPRPRIQELDQVPFPYIPGEMDSLKNRLVYYESSRGCPYDCQYCLSSTIKGVRFLSPDRVKADLTFFADHRVATVKFVDRTFNANGQHAQTIIEHILAIDNGVTKWHFEVSADRLTPDLIRLLKGARSGLFQLEIGVQSTYPPTLKEIRRFVDFDQLAAVVDQLVEGDNLHLHLDLIAGLPFESYDQFLQSFDDVSRLGPDMLQLGFLKLLHGSGLRDRKKQYGFVHSDEPPYEVLATHDINCDQMLMLKDIEHLLDHYGNSGRFSTSLSYILKGNGIRPSKFYEALAVWWRVEGHDKRSIGAGEYYELLEAFCRGRGFGDPRVLHELLRYDYYSSTSKRTQMALVETYPPTFMDETIEDLHAMNAEEVWFGHLGKKPLKNILRQVKVEAFPLDPLAFEKGGDGQVEWVDTRVLFDYTSGTEKRPACRVRRLPKRGE